MTFTSFREVIDAFATPKASGPAELARILPLPSVNYAYGLRQRNSISPGHWDALIAAASERGIPLTHEMLARLYAARRKRTRETAEEAA